jgi:hypothetical protein
MTLADVQTGLIGLSTVASMAAIQFRTILGWFYLHSFTLMRLWDKVGLWLDFTQGVLSGLSFGGALAERVLDEYAQRFCDSEIDWSLGPGPRGLSAGEVVDQNLGDRFPRIDSHHPNERLVVQIFTTDQVATLEKFLSAGKKQALACQWRSGGKMKRMPVRDMDGLNKCTPRVGG